MRTPTGAAEDTAQPQPCAFCIRFDLVTGAISYTEAVPPIASGGAVLVSTLLS